ncbi:FHA domain-containing protein, partial [Escherichia coli]|nr:FHA domain-containing protein [Escherichia coli]
EVYTGGDVAPVSAPGYDAGPSGYDAGPSGYDAGPPGYPSYEQGGGYGPPQGHVGGRNIRLVSGDGRTYPLQMGSTVIGRGDQANLRLPDVGISRRHARLDFDGGQVGLTDLGSTNGTMVNGQRVSAVALNPGD